ncbi:MAG: hypothetical protein U9R02_03535 [Thermodesulfobacteriota bacterium]|nr:hypothetical protein [Thermodesulfobacteriota bacterium]
MAADATGADATAVLVAVEGKRLNADNVLNSYIIIYTGERI